MESLWSWIVTAAGALVGTAVAVAWWEHLVRTTRPRVLPEAAVARKVAVDVCLDTLASTPPGDTATRRAALDSAIGRMAWIDTRPMVQPGAAAASEATAARTTQD